LVHRKKLPREADEYLSYLVRITGWERWWNFSVGDKSRWSPGPYDVGGTLTLYGDVVRPEGFKYPRAAITLSGKGKMMEETDHPKSVGWIDVKNGLLQAYVSVPAESMEELTVLAASDRLKIVHLNGTPLRYRRGRVNSISLNTEFDPDEW